MSLSRRTVLRSVPTLLVFVPGCLDKTGDEPMWVVDYEFERNADVDAEEDDPPTISHDADAGTITMSGVYGLGNSCYSATHSDPVYDEEADELRLRVDRSHSGADECEDIYRRAAYKLTVQYDGSAPSTVRAYEGGIGGGETVAELSDTFPW